MEDKKIRIVIGDKLTLFREGLVRILNEQSNMEVLYAAPTIKDCVEKVEGYAPDICILDTYFTEPQCLLYTQMLSQRYPELKVIELTHSEEDKDLFAALRLGARAYLSKFIDTKKLIDSIELVYNGEIIISAPMAGILLRELSDEAERGSGGETSEQPVALRKEDVEKLDKEDREFREALSLGVFKLSPREKEVLNLLYQGKTNKELAESLCISENTVKVHLRNIMEKLNASNRVHAVAIARENGLI